VRGISDIHCTLKGGGETIFPAMKVPRQCPLVLLVEVHLRDDKIFLSEEGEGFGSGLCCEQWLYRVRSEF
jgi:hypothetical protein